MKPRAATLSAILAFSLFLTPVLSHSQQSGKVYRIGYLSTMRGRSEIDAHQCQSGHYWEALVQGLQDYGYVRGQNLILDCRYTEGYEERAAALAAELAALKPDLLLGVSSAPNVLAARAAAPSTPILMVNIIDPVGRGLVPSIAHPGGTITGLANTFSQAIVGKQLQLLKAAVPTATRIAILSFVSSRVPTPGYRGEEGAAARPLHLTLRWYYIYSPEDLAGAFAAMTKAKEHAVLIEPNGFFFANRDRILALAAQHRLPAISASRELAEAGALMSYGDSNLDASRRLAVYVDKILKGAKPGDLPVEQPTKFELVINLKSAKALGLTIPQSILVRADEVIQ